MPSRECDAVFGGCEVGQAKMGTSAGADLHALAMRSPESPPASVRCMVTK